MVLLDEVSNKLLQQPLGHTTRMVPDVTTHALVLLDEVKQ